MKRVREEKEEGEEEGKKKSKEPSRLDVLCRMTPIPPEICMHIDRLVRIHPLVRESERIEKENRVLMRHYISGKLVIFENFKDGKKDGRILVRVGEGCNCEMSWKDGYMTSCDLIEAIE